MTEHEPFDLDDPYLVRLRSLALALPGAAEKLVVGHPAFYTRKVFAYFAMSRKVDGVWENRPNTVSVVLPEDERLALVCAWCGPGATWGRGERGEVAVFGRLGDGEKCGA